MEKKNFMGFLRARTICIKASKNQTVMNPQKADRIKNVEL